MVRPLSYVPFYWLWPSCVHTQPFGYRVTDWRWFLPLPSTVLPRLPPCSLIATQLQWRGYRLLIAVKPLRVSCVLSPAPSWMHSNKLLAMQLPCTQRGSPSLGPGPFSLHATVVSLIWASPESSCHIIRWMSGPFDLLISSFILCTQSTWMCLKCFLHVLKSLTKTIIFFTLWLEYLHLSIYHALPQWYQQITYTGLFPVGSW